MHSLLGKEKNLEEKAWDSVQKSEYMVLLLVMKQKKKEAVFPQFTD